MAISGVQDYVYLSTSQITSKKIKAELMWIPPETKDWCLAHEPSDLKGPHNDWVCCFDVFWHRICDEAPNVILVCHSTAVRSSWQMSNVRCNDVIINPGITCLVVDLQLSQPESWHVKHDFASADLKAEAETMDPQQRHLPLGWLQSRMSDGSFIQTF